MNFLARFILIVLFLSPAFAGEHVITVEGRFVTVGDLFQDAPARMKKTELVIAPQPGQSITLKQHWLETVAKKYGVRYTPYPGTDYVKVVSASQTLPREEIQDLLFDHIAEQMHTKAFVLSLDQEDLNLHFPKNGLPDIKIRNCQVSSNQSRFQAELELYHQGKRINRATVSGRVQRVTMVPVVNKNLPSGVVIKADDIDWVETPTNQISSRVVLDEKILIGAASKRGQILAYKPINAHEVAVPDMVQKGEAVIIRAKSPNLTISAKGKALEGGPRNGFIRVQNIDSNQVIHATIVGPKNVEVTIPGMMTLAGETKR